MKSTTLPIYARWLAETTEAELEFVDSVYKMCEDHYDEGGDNIVECYTPAEILEEFETLDGVKERIGLHLEQELNQRWGEDTDPELARAKKFETWRNNEPTTDVIQTN